MANTPLINGYPILFEWTPALDQRSSAVLYASYAIVARPELMLGIDVYVSDGDKWRHDIYENNIALILKLMQLANLPTTEEELAEAKNRLEPSRLEIDGVDMGILTQGFQLDHYQISGYSLRHANLSLTVELRSSGLIDLLLRKSRQRDACHIRIFQGDQVLVDRQGVCIQTKIHGMGRSDSLPVVEVALGFHLLREDRG